MFRVEDMKERAGRFGIPPETDARRGLGRFKSGRGRGEARPGGLEGQGEDGARNGRARQHDDTTTRGSGASSWRSSSCPRPPPFGGGPAEAALGLQSMWGAVWKVVDPSQCLQSLQGSSVSAPVPMGSRHSENARHKKRGTGVSGGSAAQCSAVHRAVGAGDGDRRASREHGVVVKGSGVREKQREWCGGCAKGRQGRRGSSTGVVQGATVGRDRGRDKGQGKGRNRAVTRCTVSGYLERLSLVERRSRELRLGRGRVARPRFRCPDPGGNKLPVKHPDFTMSLAVAHHLA